MKKPGVWITLLFGLALIAVLLYSTMGLRKHRVEVCVEFRGRQSCRIASGATKEDALRTATDNACALISAGMTDSIACGNTPPYKVTWLEGK